jgi:hypothetical protein
MPSAYLPEMCWSETGTTTEKKSNQVHTLNVAGLKATRKKRTNSS